MYDEIESLKAKLDVAVGALEKYNGAVGSYIWLADKTYIDDAASIAREALAQIKGDV